MRLNANAKRLWLTHEVAVRPKPVAASCRARNDLFPDPSHVYPPGLDRVLDVEVWKYAKDNGFILVSKDADFSELSLLQGHPPKLIWLRVGNCTTSQLEKLLRSNYEAIEQMNQDSAVGILSLL